jgi:hypothetical protein
MFRFTIRELVLLTLVVAMSVGWWVNYQQLAPLRFELDTTKRNLSWIVAALAEKGLIVEFRDDHMMFVSRKPNPWFFSSQRPPPIPTTATSP